MKEEKTFTYRSRGASDEQKDSSSKGFDIGSMLGDLSINISLKDEDKKAIQSALSEMADKMEHRWIVTQRIMIIAIGLAGVAQIVNWGLML